MPHRATRSGPHRRTINAVVVGTAAVAGIALFATLPAMAAPAAPAVPTVLVAPAGNAAADNGAPQLGDLRVPAEPAGCSAAQLRERGRQAELLAAEQAAEVRVIDTITDGSAPDKLDAIRDRAAIIVGRIADLDARCDDAPDAPVPPAPPAAPAPAEEPSTEPDRAAPGRPAAAPGALVLAPLAIACAEVDFGGVADAAAVQRATEELARNEDQLNARLESDFPRFSRRVAREADPDRARAEFEKLADDLAGTLENRRTAILDRADGGLADRFADTCEVVEAG